MYVCMYIYICMYVCMHACVHACMCSCMHVCVKKGDLHEVGMGKAIAICCEDKDGIFHEACYINFSFHLGGKAALLC